MQILPAQHAHADGGVGIVGRNDGPQRGQDPRLTVRLSVFRKDDIPGDHVARMYDIGVILHHLQERTSLSITRRAPRYYPEFWFLLHIPIVREFLSWSVPFTIVASLICYIFGMLIWVLPYAN